MDYYLCCIWSLILAQANVMLSYPVEEAEELLSTKLSSAQTSLSNCEEDLDFLREQITVCTCVSNLGYGRLTFCRLWKLQQHEYIIGRWYRSGKIRKRKRKKETNLRTGKRSLMIKTFLANVK